MDKRVYSPRRHVQAPAPICRAKQVHLLDSPPPKFLNAYFPHSDRRDEFFPLTNHSGDGEISPAVEQNICACISLLLDVGSAKDLLVIQTSFEYSLENFLLNALKSVNQCRSVCSLMTAILNNNHGRK